MPAAVGFVASVVTGATVTRTLIAVGTQLALSFIAKKLAPKASEGQAQAAAPQQVTSTGSTIPKALCYGTVTKAGTIFFSGTSGAQNRELWELHAFAGHQIDAFTTLYLEGYRPINLLTDLDVNGFCTLPEYVDSDGQKLLRILIRDGDSDQLVMNEVVTAFPGVWSSNHRARGVAYIALMFGFDFSPGSSDPDNPDKSVWDKGKPNNIRVKLRGRKVYDPRAAGHAVNDYSTWSFSDNAALCLADYLRAHPDSRIVGTFGDSYTRIDYAKVSAAADISDQAVTIPDGSGGTTTQKRYTIDASFTLDVQSAGIYEVFRQCIAGGVVYTGGTYSIMAGAGSTSIATIDGDWLAGDITQQSGPERNDRVNTVRGQYVSSASAGQPVEFSQRQDAALVAQDQESIVDEVGFAGASDEYRGQRLAWLHMRDRRASSIISATCKLHALQLSVGELVDVELSDLNISGQYQVQTWKLSRLNTGPGNSAPVIDVGLRKVHPNGFDVPISDLDEVATIQGLAESDYAPSAVTNLSTANGVGQIVLEWNNPPQTDIDRVEVWSSTTNNRASATKRSQTTAEEFVDVQPNNTTRYYWLIVYGRNGLTSDWTPLGATSGIMGMAQGVTGGADAVAVSLHTSRNTFHFSKTNDIETLDPAGQAATLFVARENTTDLPAWETTPNVTLFGAANAITRTLTGINFGGNESVEISITLAGRTRTVTIGRVVDGQDAVLPSGTPTATPESGPHSGTDITISDSENVKVEVTGSATMTVTNPSSVSGGQITAALKRGTTTIKSLVLSSTIESSPILGEPDIFTFPGLSFSEIDSPSNGTHTYSIEITVSGNTGNVAFGSSGTILLTPLKS